MQEVEEIKAHLFWVWRENHGFFKRGREGMLVITNKRFNFIIKTDMTFRMHDAYSLRQLQRFKDAENVFRPAEGYRIVHLERDLNKSPDNLEIILSEILEISSEEKAWGTLLKVNADVNGEENMLLFSIVKGWIKYPVVEPLQFQRVDWAPLFDLVSKYKSSSFTSI